MSFEDFEDPTPATTKWHVEKGIPLALVYILIAQFAAGVWFMSAMFKELENNNRRITVMEQQRVSERLGVLETQVADSKILLQSLNSNILRLLENQGRNH